MNCNVNLVHHQQRRIAWNISSVCLFWFSILFLFLYSLIFLIFLSSPRFKILEVKIFSNFTVSKIQKNFSNVIILLSKKLQLSFYSKLPIFFHTNTPIHVYNFDSPISKIRGEITESPLEKPFFTRVNVLSSFLKEIPWRWMTIIKGSNFFRVAFQAEQSCSIRHHPKLCNGNIAQRAAEAAPILPCSSETLYQLLSRDAASSKESSDMVWCTCTVTRHGNSPFTQNH